MTEIPMFTVLVINGAYVILSAFVVVISDGDEWHKKKKKKSAILCRQREYAVDKSEINGLSTAVRIDDAITYGLVLKKVRRLSRFLMTYIPL